MPARWQVEARGQGDLTPLWEQAISHTDPAELSLYHDDQMEETKFENTILEQEVTANQILANKIAGVSVFASVKKKVRVKNRKQSQKPARVPNPVTQWGRWPSNNKRSNLLKSSNISNILVSSANATRNKKENLMTNGRMQNLLNLLLCRRDGSRILASLGLHRI